MKRFFLVSSLAVQLFSCSKNNDAPAAAAISGTIDGTNVTFNTNAKAIRTDVSGAYAVSIVGFQGTGTANQIAIAISSTRPIAAGTYSENGSAGTNAGGVNYVQAGTPYICYNSPGNPATIIVTAVSATSIQGTFSGDVFQTSANGVSATKKVITKGQFNVKF